MKLKDYFNERLLVCKDLEIQELADSDEFMIKYRLSSEKETDLSSIRSDLLASRFSEELLDYEVNDTLTLLPRRLLIGDKGLYNLVMTIKQFSGRRFLACIAVVSQIVVDDNGNEYCTWYKTDYAN